MVWLGAKFGEIWGFSPLTFVTWHLQETGIAALPKFRERWLLDIRESESGKIFKKH